MELTIESMAQMWDDMQSLLQEHYDEIAHDKDAFPLAPSRARYEAMEREGKLLWIACREDGAMIGYSVFFIFPHIHYETTLVGVNDVLFVTRKKRKSRAGLMLIHRSESELKARGVKKVTWHVKPENDWSPILTHGGYHLMETTYGKLL